MTTQTRPLVPSVDAAIEATEDFFKLALKDRNDNRYISQKLAGSDSVDDKTHLKLLNGAGSLLLQIHNAVSYDKSSEQSYDSSLLLAVYKLLDFITLEGIYPSLPPGIRALTERRAKSVFYRHDDPSYRAPRGSDTLEYVLNSIMQPLLKAVGSGIEPMVRHRILNDLILAAFWPTPDKPHRVDQHYYHLYFSKYVNDILIRWIN
jgi:hypothetical protein